MEGIGLLEEYDNYFALIYLKIHLTWGIRCYTKITTARGPGVKISINKITN